MVYTTPTTNAFDRPPAVVNLPPPSLSIRNGHFIRREQPDIDHLAKLLMRTIHTATEGNVIGLFRQFVLKGNLTLFERNMRKM